MRTAGAANGPANGPARGGRGHDGLVPESPGPVEPGSGQVEWIDLGNISAAESTEHTRRRRLKPVHLVLVVAVLVVVAIGVVGGAGRGAGPNTTRPSPSATSPAISATDSGPTGPAVVPAQPVVKQVSPDLLGVQANWELFARGPNVVVRVELAAGRVTTTGVPAIQSSGPVAFVVGADRVIIRPLDDVPAFVVKDESPATRLTGALAQANLVLPGPDLMHVWRQLASSTPPTLGLATLDGTVVGGRFTTPATASSPLEPDGAGYFYFLGVGGAYDVRSGSLNRVTTGTPVAVGPLRWVAVECDDAYRCSTVVVDVSTSTRRVLGGPRPTNVPIGSVSPDGSVAAAYQLGPTGAVSLQLLDLSSGRVRPVRTQLSPDLSDGTTVWAPDSSRLFVIDAKGAIQVVDPATGTARPLGMSLPALSQLAIRATR